MATVLKSSPVNKAVKRFEDKLKRIKLEGTQGMREITAILKEVFGSTTDEIAQLIKHDLFTNAINSETGLPIGTEQTEQCKQWLLNLWKTPTGAERKNNPFSNEEETILENFSKVVWTDTRCVNQKYGHYTPIFSVYDNQGNYFNYYMWGGNLHLV